MLSYLKYKMQEEGCIKWICICVILENLIFSFWKDLRQHVTVFEAILITLSDKLLLSTAITLPVFLIASNCYSINNQELQIIFRVKNSRTWFWYNQIYMICMVSIYIIVCIVIFAIVGILHNMSRSAKWSEAAYYLQLNPVGGIDYTGFPFETLILNKNNPIISVGAGLILLFLRCVFFLEIQCYISLLSSRLSIGQIVATVFNYIDVFFYNVFFNSRFGVLPHEHSIITCIDGQRPSILISFIYWIIIIMSVVVLQYINTDNITERIKKAAE